ncbi:ankyrin repeat domain-containing protein [Rhodoferax sp.]|uniref:ankyrin repeat domain-containing protein n=1 Tax=Rhodoferax sp. TaxID=50421 RepID=UPI0025F22304|nr:ankyrin repeat domain-containing protein [Rhodoferax sp.]MCM2341224.1 ankyrin repeat domain-containing protein [Rhodoferax sp.]
MKYPFSNSINYFKKLVYIIVLIGFNVVNAGSYEDFFKAIKQDNAVDISALLNRGFDPNTLDATGLPGLLLALKNDAFKVASVLLSHPQIKVEVRNSADESPLMLAALKGELQLCRLMIQKGGDVNKPGWAPLHYAATHGHLAVLNLLLEEHAYIDAASPNNTTPLMMAAHYGTPAAVKLLLEAGADPMLKNDLGLNAIDFAVRAQRIESADIISAFVRGKQAKGSW